MVTWTQHMEAIWFITNYILRGYFQTYASLKCTQSGLWRSKPCAIYAYIVMIFTAFSLKSEK